MLDLKQRRIELGLTMLEVANLVGVSEATISRYESGDIKNMRRERIGKYAMALQVSPSDFLDIDEDYIKTHEFVKTLISPDNTSQQVKDENEYIDKVIAISEKPYDDKPTFPPKRGGLKAAKIKKPAPDEVRDEPIAIKATTSDWERILSNMSDDNRQKLQDYAELLLLSQDQDGQGD